MSQRSFAGAGRGVACNQHHVATTVWTQSAEASGTLCRCWHQQHSYLAARSQDWNRVTWREKHVQLRSIFEECPSRKQVSEVISDDNIACHKLHVTLHRTSHSGVQVQVAIDPDLPDVRVLHLIIGSAKVYSLSSVQLTRLQEPYVAGRCSTLVRIVLCLDGLHRECSNCKAHSIDSVCQTQQICCSNSVANLQLHAAKAAAVTEWAD
jgi:hypothetical protein